MRRYASFHLSTTRAELLAVGAGNFKLRAAARCLRFTDLASLRTRAAESSPVAGLQGQPTSYAARSVAHRW